MKHPQEFYVCGRGHFPFDMLRYDACYPADGLAVAAMEQSGGRNVRVVRLRLANPERGFTAGRWASFGWSANEHDIFS